MEYSSLRAVKQTWPFLLVMGVFWAVLGYLLLTFGYAGSFVRLNAFHIPILDEFSYYFLTHLGDGLILPLLILLFMWWKKPEFAIAGVTAVLLAGLLSQLLKRLVFDDWGRPANVFAGNPEVLIFHPDPPMNHAFPSGHATTMAAGGLVFAWFAAEWRRSLGTIVGLFTVLLCYTRVILGVHFPGDIFVGSLIGCSVAIIATPLFAKLWGKLLVRSGPLWKKRLQITVFVVGILGIAGQFVHLILKQS